MKIKSPIVTLVAGIVLAAIVVVLSVRAHEAATKPQPSNDPYSAAFWTVTR